MPDESGKPKVEIVGPVRRKLPEVEWIDVLYVSASEEKSTDKYLMGQGRFRMASMADELLEKWLLPRPLAPKDRRQGFPYETITKRLDAGGGVTWLEDIKHARHIRTGIPINFYQANGSTWWNRLALMTSGPETVKRLHAAALEKGWIWEPDGSGLTSIATRQMRPVTSQEDLFEFLGVPYGAPEERK